MVVSRKFCLWFFVLLALTHFVVAQNLLVLSEIEDSYVNGEYFLINASVNNIFEYPVLVNVESLLSNEQGTFPSAVIPFEFRLEPGEEKKIEVYNFLIDESFLSDKYVLDIRVLFDRNELVKKSLEFDIFSIKVFSFSIKSDKKVFTQGEDIDLDYTSDISDLIIGGVLTYPDKSTKSITLPTSIKASQIGTYELEVSASKEGYKTLVVSEQFGVIKGDVKIQETNIRIKGINIDSEKEFFNKKVILYILGGILFLIIIILIIMYMKKESN